VTAQAPATSSTPVSDLTMPSLFPSALALVLSASCFAQQPVEAWRLFQAQHGSDSFQADWNEATGTPKAIYGRGLPIAPRVSDDAHAAELGEDVLRRHAELLGLGRSTFRLVTRQRVRDLYVLVYEQLFEGIEVLGGRADVRIHASGVVSMFGSKAVAIPESFRALPRIDPDYAWALGHQHLGATPQASQSKPVADLVIHALVDSEVSTTPRLAWRVRVDVRDRTKCTTGDVFVDAFTGDILEFRDAVHRCGLAPSANDDAATRRHLPAPRGHLGLEIARGRSPAKTPTAITGNVRAWLHRGDPTQPTTNEPLQGLLVTASGVGTAYTDSNGNFSIPYAGSGPVTVDVSFGAGSGAHLGGGITPQLGTPIQATAQATPGTPVQIQLLAPNPAEFDAAQTTTFWHVDDIHRWVEGLAGTIPTTRYDLDSLQATVNIAASCNAYYVANTINFYAAGGSCNMTAYDSVIYHEWGHAVDDAFGGISQLDGLSEGWGDILATYRLGDPIVGRNFTTSGGFVRTATNTATYPVVGTVHQQGQTWMGFAWDLRNLLMATHGPVTGASIAEQIVIPTLTANATTQPDAVREVFLLDDDDGNLNNGTPNCDDLIAAAVGRNLPTPIQRCQGAGVWTTFGQGCAGSATSPLHCASLNGSGGGLLARSFSNEYLYGHRATQAGTLEAVELYTASSTTAPESTQIAIYLESSTGTGIPALQPVRTGTLSVGSIPGFHRAVLDAPLPYRDGDALWIGQADCSRIYPAVLQSGQDPSLPIFWRRTGTSGNWLQTATLRYPSWRWICTGAGQPGAVPVLTAQGEPKIGQTFTLDLLQAAPTSQLILALGGWDIEWYGVSLPLDLGAVGATGCTLFAPLHSTIQSVSTASGTVRWNLQLPNDPIIVGSSIYLQALIADAAANQLGFSFSNAGRMLIGRP